MTTAVLEQTVVTIVRVTTTYRAVELGLSVVWLGVISAAIAVLPLLLAVKVGRYIDRGNETRTAMIGAGLLCVSCAGFARLAVARRACSSSRRCSASAT